jgi:hypothetical protein
MPREKTIPLKDESEGDFHPSLIISGEGVLVLCQMKTGAYFAISSKNNRPGA